MKQILFLLLLPLVPLFSQKSAVLEEYIQTGLRSNTALQQQTLDLQKATEAVREAKGLFYPTVQFVANYTVAAGGRRIGFPIGDILNPVYANLNQLNERLAPGSPQYPTNLENVNEQFLPNNFHETKVKFSYPLYNTDVRYNRQIKEQVVQSKSAQKAAYEQQLRYQISEAYLQYLQSLEAEKIIVNTKAVLTELRRFNESLVKNNVATREVVSTADYELSKIDNENFSLKTKQNTARAYFNFLVNRDLQAEVTVDTAILRGTLPVYAREEMIQQALGKRQEFNALRAGQAAAELDIIRNEANRKRPDAYIGGEMGFQGFGYTFNSEQAYILTQVGVTYDIFNGGQTKSKTQQAKIEAEKIRTQFTEAQQQISLQVTLAWNELEAAKNAWATNQRGLRAAEEVFRIVNNKYRAQQALLIEFLDAQNRVQTAKLQVLLTWIEVLTKEVALKKAAGL